MATAAVFLALGGGAYAAIRVPRNSVGNKQLKNGSVSTKKLQARSVAGANIKQGSVRGANVDLSTLGQAAPLPPGKTETGGWGASAIVGGSHPVYVGFVSFPIPLAAPLDAAHVIIVPLHSTVTHCPGPGSADSGYLCVYQESGGDVPHGISNPEADAQPGSGAHGFQVEVTAGGTGTEFAAGSYAVTG